MWKWKDYSFRHIAGQIIEKSGKEDLNINEDFSLGPGIYCQLYGVGMFTGDRFAVGSGAQDANVVLDEGYCYDMTVEEAVELAQRAIYHATEYTSGGTVSVYYVGPDGCKKLSCDDVGVLHFKKMVAKDTKSTGATKAHIIPFDRPGLFEVMNSAPDLTPDMIEHQFNDKLQILNQLKELWIKQLQAELEEKYLCSHVEKEMVSSKKHIMDIPKKAEQVALTSTQKQIMDKVEERMSVLEDEIRIEYSMREDDSKDAPLNLKLAERTQILANKIPDLARDVIEEQHNEEVQSLHQLKTSWMKKLPAKFEGPYGWPSVPRAAPSFPGSLPQAGVLTHPMPRMIPAEDSPSVNRRYTLL